MLGNQGALLTLVLENNGSEDNVAFDNIVVAEPDMTTLKVGAFNDNVSQSGIKEMNAAVRIYQCRTILLQKALCSKEQGQATDFQPLVYYFFSVIAPKCSPFCLREASQSVGEICYTIITRVSCSL